MIQGRETAGGTMKKRDRYVVWLANAVLNLASPWYRKRIDLIIELGKEEYMEKSRTCSCHLLRAPHNPHFCREVIDANRAGIKEGEEKVRQEEGFRG